MPNLCADVLLGTVAVGLNVCICPAGKRSRSHSLIEESAPPDMRLFQSAQAEKCRQAQTYILFSISIDSAFTPA